MADRVAVFNQGKIAQIGTPQDIYRRPATRFVADFVGSSNVLPPDFTAAHGDAKAWASLRPESIRLADKGIEAVLVSRSFLGATVRVILDAGGTRLTAVLPASIHLPEDGSMVFIGWDRADLHVMETSP